MKAIAFSFALFFVHLTAFSQLNGNEWIDYSQSYYKIPVAETGVYKLTYEVLLSSGINPATIPSDNFQMYGREKQIPLSFHDR